MDDRGKTPVIRDQDARSLVSSHVGDIYTPDVPIFDPALFSGRRDDVEQFRRLLATPGTTIAIFGERGVGKTSLCCASRSASPSQERFTRDHRGATPDW